MKQTVNISLSGIAFSVESEGYDKLNNYLDSIKNGYDNAAEVEELLSDIEARITELILNKQSAAIPVSEALVDEIIAQLGYPIDGEKKIPTPPKFDEEQQEQQARRPFNKRLYRNPKGAMLGGVCTGFASYFKIDATIIRLCFVAMPLIPLILFMFAGFYLFSIDIIVVMLYLVLWIVIPKAQTPRQFLEMEGEPITKDNIERFLRDEMIDVDNNISRITRSEKSASVLSSMFYAIGRVIKFIFYSIGVMIMFGLSLGIVVGIGFLIYGFTVYNVYFTNLLVGNIYVNLIAAILIGLVPLFMILMVLTRPIFKVNPNKFIYVILWALWLIAVVYATTIGIKTIDRYKYSERHSEQVVMTLEGKTLYLNSFDDKGNFAASDNLYIDKDMLVKNSVYINSCGRHKSDDNKITITFNKKAYASLRKEAYEKAKESDIEYRIEGDTLYLKDYTKITSPENIMNSNDIDIHMPKHIKCSNGIKARYY